MPFITEDGDLLVSDLQHMKGPDMPPMREVNAASAFGFAVGVCLLQVMFAM